MFDLSGSTMTTPERPSFVLPVTPFWPTEIPDDFLSKIPIQDKIPYVSVAEFVLEESSDAIFPDLAYARVTQENVHIFIACGVIVKTYCEPAKALLDAQVYVASGQLPQQKPLDPAFERLFVLGIQRAFSKNTQSINTEMLVGQVEWQTIIRIIGERLKTKGPNDAIDHFAQLMIEKYLKNKSKIFVDATEHGLRRFHQLYKAVQQLPEPPTKL